MPTDTDLLAPPPPRVHVTTAAARRTGAPRAAVAAHRHASPGVDDPPQALPCPGRASAVDRWPARLVTVMAVTTVLSAFAPTPWLTWGILALAAIRTLGALLTRLGDGRQPAAARTRVRLPAHQPAPRPSELYTH